MSRTAAFILTLAAGGLVALQPPANAALAHRVGDFGAAVVSAAITLTVLAIVLVVAGTPSRLSALGSFRPVWLLGGLGGASIVAVSLIAVRPLGAAGVTALTVTAQLIVSVVADRLGWFGLHPVSLGIDRLAGVVLVVGGTVLLTRA